MGVVDKLVSLSEKYKRKRKILIIGYKPPPITGVSVFLDRVMKQLNDKKIPNQLFIYSGESKARKLFKLFYLLFHGGRYIIYLNLTHFELFALLSSRLIKTEIIYYDHNFRVLERLNKWQKYIFKRFLKQLTELHVVNHNVVDYYKQHGIFLEEKINVVSPFLSPDVLEADKKFAEYSVELKYFLDNHRPLLLSSAYALTFYQGVDTYGFDLCLKLISELRKIYPNPGLILFLANPNYNRNYYKILKENIITDHLEDFIFLNEGPIEMWPIMPKVDIFLRPTNTDGDAISVREALFFDCPVVASDVCPRPDGVSVFKNRDFDDFLQKVIAAIQLEIK
jgi:glycosyltransferase involved in cell wall biosynthesis